mmetsp:Transcript_73964/g.111422  ORF Transcript_73964/g.111422 Transcript_73964/m.111422 type:complete len:254 (-) Transcript_73964:428-1189(-)
MVRSGTDTKHRRILHRCVWKSSHLHRSRLLHDFGSGVNILQLLHHDLLSSGDSIPLETGTIREFRKNHAFVQRLVSRDLWRFLGGYWIYESEPLSMGKMFHCCLSSGMRRNQHVHQRYSRCDGQACPFGDTNHYRVLLIVCHHPCHSMDSATAKPSNGSAIFVQSKPKNRPTGCDTAVDSVWRLLFLDLFLDALHPGYIYCENPTTGEDQLVSHSHLAGNVLSPPRLLQLLDLSSWEPWGSHSRTNLENSSRC